MGICSSCESTATSISTAKLIHQDGRLQEFPYPIKASYVLQSHPTAFICNSDYMDFDVGVCPVSAEEELLPGQIYFALPLSRLRRPLHPQEMAALAVRASAALAASDKCRYRRRPILAAAVAEKVIPPPQTTAVDGRHRRRRSSGGGGSAEFRINLSVIPE